MASIRRGVCGGPNCRIVSAAQPVVLGRVEFEEGLRLVAGTIRSGDVPVARLCGSELIRGSCSSAVMS